MKKEKKLNTDKEKVFNASAAIEMIERCGFTNPDYIEEVISDDGLLMVPYGRDGYINRRLNIVHKDFVIDKKMWVPYEKNK